jgi:threonine synthase
MRKLIISLACAHPAKFPDAVIQATGITPTLPPHLDGLRGLRGIMGWQAMVEA